MPLSKSIKLFTIIGTGIILSLLSFSLVSETISKPRSSVQNVPQIHPPIDWSERSVTAIISPGERKEIEIILTAMQPLGNIELDIVKGLESMVKLEPSSLSNVIAGQAIPIKLLIQADANTRLKTYGGVLQVREANNKGKGKGNVLSQPLPLKILIQESQGIAGTDNDGNGIWDYIDEYIEEVFPGAEAAPIRAAARQYALAKQKGMLNADNRDLSHQIAIESNQAASCMFHHKDDAYEDLDKLDAAILNTADRTRAYLIFNDQLGGQIFRLPPEELESTFCKN